MWGDDGDIGSSEPDLRHPRVIWDERTEFRISDSVSCIWMKRENKAKKRLKKQSFSPKAFIETPITGREKTLGGRLLVVNFYRLSVALSKAALS